MSSSVSTDTGINQQQRRSSKRIRRDHSTTRHVSYGSASVTGQSNTGRLNQEKTLDAGNGNSTVDSVDVVTVAEDDICPICQLLLCQPVITRCGHTLCEACLAQWAEMSTGSRMAPIDLEQEIPEFTASSSSRVTWETLTSLEASCPMCRTQTTAKPDLHRARQLSTRYAVEYAQRLHEGAEEEVLGDAGVASRVSSSRKHSTRRLQAMTIYIGNLHQHFQQRPSDNGEDDADGNVHEWTLFVRPSRSDVIEEVQVLLHPTFRPSRIIRTRPPFAIRRLGWGTFTVTAYIILKAGYQWKSLGDAVEMENSPDGAVNGMVGLAWDLDFQGFGGRGAMKRVRLQVVRDGVVIRKKTTANQNHQRPRQQPRQRQDVRQTTTTTQPDGRRAEVTNARRTRGRTAPTNNERSGSAAAAVSDLHNHNRSIPMDHDPDSMDTTDADNHHRHDREVDAENDEEDDEDDESIENDVELQRDNRAWQRMVREYHRDGRWEPDGSDED